jgi:polysaccharide export outer membrane protein
MKRFVIILSLSVLSGAAAHAQKPSAPDKNKQPALVLPPVVITPRVAKPEPSQELPHKKNHPSLNTAPAPAPLLTETYRIGPGDVLDVRLLNFSSRQSSLFTVQPDGNIVYPYLSEPVKVEGLTAEEVAARLNSLIKIFDKPQAVVTVRRYASHTVNVTGLAAKTGPQSLQREAVPLFVVLALVQPAPEAQRAVIMRAGKPVAEIALSDTAAHSFLLQAGDEISLRLPAPAPVAPPKPKEFFYVIGTVHTPGEREFRAGMTLTQAIFAAGGLSKQGKDAKIRLLRQGADGRLMLYEYNLKRISQGKDPDPSLRAGDRLEVAGKD